MTPRWVGQTLSRPVVLAMAVLAVYALVVLGHLHGHGWDPTVFIVAGDRFADRTQLVTPIAILPDSAGYDGEFYYRLALDPFTSDLTRFGITIDNGATRGARIGYPFLAWAASLGQPAWLAWAMIGVNLAGLFAIAWMATAFARSQRLPAWAGLAIPLYPGFLLTLVRDTTEVTACLFGLAAVILALSRRYWLAAGALCLGVMTRETALLYLAGFGAVEATRALWQRRWSWRLLPLTVPALVFLAWQSFVARHWGALSYSGTAQNLGMPFAGFVEFVTTQLQRLQGLHWPAHDFKLYAFYLGIAGFSVGMACLVATLVLRGRVTPALATSWLFYTALMSCLTTAVLAEPWDYMRGFTDWTVIGMTAIIQSRQTGTAAVLVPMLAAAWCGTLWYL